MVPTRRQPSMQVLSWDADETMPARKHPWHDKFLLEQKHLPSPTDPFFKPKFTASHQFSKSHRWIELIIRNGTLAWRLYFRAARAWIISKVVLVWNSVEVLVVESSTIPSSLHQIQKLANRTGNGKGGKQIKVVWNTYWTDLLQICRIACHVLINWSQLLGQSCQPE